MNIVLYTIILIAQALACQLFRSPGADGLLSQANLNMKEIFGEDAPVLTTVTSEEDIRRTIKALEDKAPDDHCAEQVDNSKPADPLDIGLGG